VLGAMNGNTKRAKANFLSLQFSFTKDNNALFLKRSIPLESFYNHADT